MSKLDGIIRFKKWELDEKRRLLVTFQDELARLEQALEALYEERARESQLSASSGSPVMLGEYLEGCRLRAEQLLQFIEIKDKEVSGQRDIVAAAFQDLKTFEIAAEREQEREKTRAVKVEQNMLDEQGLRTFRRMEDSNG